ncbi:MAG: rhomboid family intramembrane serine protease [Acutalibacteraceae bacterium]|nr:rhomboid family intramembrane serine protease [Acutalibacteraceae bacterium]
MPVFTVSFCVIIALIYIIDNFIAIPRTETVTLKEKLWSGHNKGYINHALHLSEKKIRKGQVWRLVSSSLLHIGTWHIISNVTATLIVGYAVESRLGAVKTLLCFVGSVLVSGLYMAFVYKLQEGEGASTGIYGLIAVFVMLAVKNGTVMFSGLPLLAIIILAVYTVGGMLVGKATAWEHISGFAGGLLMGFILI